MPSYVCQVCKIALHCIYKGNKTKPTIEVSVPWQNTSLTVMSAGEHCLPCPRCETADGEIRISYWEQADTRLHKRLRQHFSRHHQAKLKDIYSPAEIIKFYADARTLRCQLIHGPTQTSSIPLSEPDREETSLGPSAPPRPRNTSKPSSPAESPILPSVPAREESPLRDQPEASIGPSTPPRKRIRNLSSKASQLIVLPQNFLNWLKEEVSIVTCATYVGIVRSFIFSCRNLPSANGTLADVWNFDTVKYFLDEKKAAGLKPSTLFNYLMALMAAQRYVRLEGEVDPPPLINLKFKSLMKQLSRGKAAHYLTVSEEKRQKSTMLHEVKEKIINNSALHRRFQVNVNATKCGASLSQSDYTWSTGYAVFTLQASNFKRNGNLAKIEFRPAMKRLKSALKHHKSFEIEIHGATKTGGIEVFSVVKRERIQTLFDYGRYIRQTAMGSGRCSTFFVNSVGTTITQIAPFIKALGKSVDLPHLTIKDLRSRIETEAAFQGDKVSRSHIASHLAHTEATRDRHYLLADKRVSRKAAIELERLIEGAEPLEFSEAETSDANTTDDEEPDADPAQSTPPSSPTSVTGEITTVPPEEPSAAPIVRVLRKRSIITASR